MTFRYIATIVSTMLYAVLMAGFISLYFFDKKWRELFLALMMFLYILFDTFKSLSGFLGSFTLSYFNWTFVFTLVWQLLLSCVYIGVITTQAEIKVNLVDRLILSSILVLSLVLAIFKETRGYYHILLYFVFLWGIIRILSQGKRDTHTRILLFLLTITFVGQVGNGIYSFFFAKMPPLISRSTEHRQNYWFLTAITIPETVCLILELCFRFKHQYKLQQELEAIRPSREERISAISEEFKLTPREAEILGLISDGLTNREIAEKLYVAESTVKVHIYNIYKKLGVSRRAQVASMISE